MIPFARMVQYGKVIEPGGLLLDVDYSTATLGSAGAGVPDAAGTPFMLRAHSGSPVSGTVVYDADLGVNVLDCSLSTGYYRTVLPVQGTKLDFSQYDAFEIQYRMKCSSTGIQTFIETGNYNSRRIFGFTNSFNQYSTNYNQLFIDWGDVYQRALPAWVNPNAWDTITIQFRKGISITMHSELIGSTYTSPWYPIVSGDGQYLSLFGSYVDGDNGSNAYIFNGRVQYIKIRELI